MDKTNPDFSFFAGGERGERGFTQLVSRAAKKVRP